MTQPLDRTSELPQLGVVDHDAGEFWVENPFSMKSRGMNLSAYERNRFYLNLDGKEFVDASFASAVDLDSDSRSVVAADFDRDGSIDLLVGSDGGGPLRLFLNRIPKTQNSIRIELTGAQSNRPAIGSRVTIDVGGRSIVRDLLPANGFMGQGPAELVVGIGEVDEIDRMTVRWPTGIIQELVNIPVPEDRVFKITERQP